jgi:hypothetical protein
MDEEVLPATAPWRAPATIGGHGRARRHGHGESARYQKPLKESFWQVTDDDIWTRTVRPRLCVSLLSLLG